MYLWQRLASPSWWVANEEEVRAAAGSDLAIIERPDHKRFVVEIACLRCTRARDLERRFGGRFKKLPGNWLKRFAREQETKPLAIGTRLVIVNVGETSASRRPGGIHTLSGHQGPSHIVVPAGAAFGTGHHATTAMSLRLLEQLTRTWKPGWSLVDLGTGSGIFALAASRFGAQKIVAIDNDPVAISTAKGNARLNRIPGIDFQMADVRKLSLPRRIDVITANLFSDLLIEILPKFRDVRWLVLSGIMRNQERDVVQALKRLGMNAVKIRRRGKWIAMLVSGSTRSRDL